MKKQNLNFGEFTKKVFVIVLLLNFVQNSFSQTNAIKMAFISEGKTKIDYERAVTSTSSAIIGIKYYNKAVINNFTSKGVRLTSEYRIYLTKRSKPFSGIYAAPNLSMGRHEVHYERTTGSGLGLGLLAATIDLAVDGELDNSFYLKPPKTITGDAIVIAHSIGLKIGVQKRWNHFLIDFGINLTKNAIAGKSKGIQLSDGAYKKFNSSLIGNRPEGYFGIGFAF